MGWRRGMGVMHTNIPVGGSMTMPHGHVNVKAKLGKENDLREVGWRRESVVGDEEGGSEARGMKGRRDGEGKD